MRRRRSCLLLCAVALLLAVPACAAAPTPLTTPSAGRLYSDFTDLAFPGGALRFRLMGSGDDLAQWVINTYDVALTLDVTYDSMGVTLPEAGTVVVPAQSAVRIAAVRRDSGLKWHLRLHYRAQFGDPAARAAPYAYALPYPAGETHRVAQGFGGTFSHTGNNEFAVDFEMSVGTPVRAAREGVVVAYHDTATSTGLSPAFRDYAQANWILVRQPDGTLAEYFHLAPHGVQVRIGQVVARGDVLGRSGNTGYSQGPHLHFAVRTAITGAASRSFPLTFQTAVGDAAGELPVEGKRYTAFEAPVGATPVAPAAPTGRGR